MKSLIRDTALYLALVLLFLLGAIGFSYAYQAWQDLGEFYLVISLLKGIGIFLNFYLPAHLAILTVLYSFVFPNLNKPYNIKQILYSFLVILLLSTAFSTLNQHMLIPLQEDLLEDFLFTNQTSRQFLLSAQQALEEGNTERGIELLEQYLLYHPEDIPLQQQLFNLEREEGKRKAKSLDLPRPEANDLQFYSFSKLLDLAREEDNPVMAYHYLLIAENMNPQNSQLQEEMERTRNKLSRLNLTREERDREELYRKKREFLNALLSGDPITAYYGFMNLLEKNPNDADLAKYYYMSLGTLQKRAFFQGEAERNLRLPGKKPLFFINNTDPLEIITAEKMVTTGEGTYWKDLNQYIFDPEGTMELHIYSPYGKLIGDQIYLRALHQDNYFTDFFPRIRQGDRAALDLISIPLRVSPQNLLSTPLFWRDLERISLPQLTRLMQDNSHYPYLPLLLDIEFLNRMIKPFLFFSLSALWGALSFRHRREKWTDFFTMGLISLPLVMFFAYYARILIDYSFSLAGVVTLKYLGLGLTLGVMAGVFFVFIFMMLLWLAYSIPGVGKQKGGI